MAEAHDGRIVAKNRSDQPGAIFCVRRPLPSDDGGLIEPVARQLAAAIATSAASIAAVARASSTMSLA